MDTETVEAYVDAAAAALDLPIAPAHRPGVLNYFALAAGFAAQLEAVALGPADEPAEAFAPIGPGELPS